MTSHAYVVLPMHPRAYDTLRVKRAKQELDSRTAVGVGTYKGGKLTTLIYFDQTIPRLWIVNY